MQQDLRQHSLLGGYILIPRLLYSFAEPPKPSTFAKVVRRLTFCTCRPVKDGDKIALSKTDNLALPNVCHFTMKLRSRYSVRVVIEHDRGLLVRGQERFPYLLDQKNTFTLPTTRYPSLSASIMVNGQHDIKMF